MGVFDFIFPKYCVSCRMVGEYICPNCFVKISFDTQLVCFVCNKPSFDGRTHPVCRKRQTIDGAFVSVAYRGVVKKLLYQFKYKPYVSHLQTSITDLFYEGIIQQELFHQRYTSASLLVPIPLSKKRLMKRGYNHAALLAEELGKKLGVLSLEILTRIKETRSQYGLTQKERHENMQDAFDLKPEVSVQGKVIFLVDDIITTGSTLLEAAKVLKEHGAREVWGLAFARD